RALLALLRWKHVDWEKFRIYVVSNFVRGKFGEPKSAASKKPAVLHSLVMGLLKNWRETTAYAGDEDFIFASDRLKGKQPRVPNMLAEDHLRPAAKQVIEIPPQLSTSASTDILQSNVAPDVTSM